MWFLIWIIVGGIAGWVASKIMSTDASMGITANVIVGMIGSLIGGTLWTWITSGDFSLINGFTGLNLGSLIVSILGSVILIWLIKLFNRSSATA